ncbi:unnamed protein product [Vicia faba]|uniref:protein-serine/threonine phosphatase n=1 Tax=Vicia faba TaxID=3906 RepID=A0AAV1A9G5_VICFA|nr:unnamed protein product [Vicia faba]
MKDVKRHSLESSFSRVDSVESVKKLENVHRRRLKIRRMKYSCQTKVHGGDDFSGGTKTERREIHESVEISLSLASSSSSEEEDRSWKQKDEDEDISYGSVSVIGCRKEMEDAVSVEIGFAVKESEKCDFFAVYDGHGGAQVAEVCRERLHQVVAEEMERYGNNDVEWEWERVMEGCFGKMDREVAGNAAVRTVGTTAVVAVMVAGEIVVANCGDSRAVLGRGGQTFELSSDHKPERPDELMRIEEAGGRVINWNGHRVLGVLATSRSIGDEYLRPYVISKPEVTVTKRSSEDEFLILASDGLWGVMSSEIACQVVRKCFKGQIRRVCDGVGNQTSRAAEAAALLSEIALAKGSRDNTSVIVVDLRGTLTST